MINRVYFVFCVVMVLFVQTQSFAQVSSEGVPVKIAVSPYGKFFKGDGLEVEMAVFNEKNRYGLQDVLLKFQGESAFAEDIDGKIIKYESTPAGSGVDFKYKKKKEIRTRMMTRNHFGDKSLVEVYLNGKTIKVILDEKRSKEIKTSDLWKQFSELKK